MLINKKVVNALFLLAVSSWTSAQEPVPMLPDGSALVLFGMGEYENLGEDIYVGAIYLPLLDVTIEPGKSKRMEMRISAKSLSARRFSRFWLDAITLNSSRAERTALVDSIQAFGEIFQLSLVAGDQVVFDYLSASDETVIQINGVVVSSIAGEAFYAILLDSWIGATPHSAQLKAGLMSQLDLQEQAATKSVYASLAYSAQRRQEIDHHYNLENEQEQQAQQQLQEQARLAEQARQAELARLQAQQRQREEQEQAAVIAAAEAASKQAEEDRVKFEAAQQALAEKYRLELVQWLSRHVIYPKAALQREEEGRVELTIVTGRAGKILSHEISKSSTNYKLDNAALDMLEEAQPLPAMPADLAGDSFKFLMPVSFSLQ